MNKISFENNGVVVVVVVVVAVVGRKKPLSSLSRSPPTVVVGVVVHMFVLVKLEYQVNEPPAFLLPSHFQTTNNIRLHHRAGMHVGCRWWW